MEEISTSDEHRARSGPDLLLRSRNQQILQTLHVHSILFWSFSLRVESTAFTSRTGPKEPPLFRFTFELHEQSPAHLVTVATTDKLENETH